MLSYNDLVEHYNSVCEKCKQAVERANKAIAEKACLEIELVSLRSELKESYRIISELESVLFEGKK
jgi:hypothetical protein